MKHHTVYSSSNDTSILALITSLLVEANIGWKSNKTAKTAAWQHVIILPFAMLPTYNWLSDFSPFEPKAVAESVWECSNMNIRQFEDCGNSLNQTPAACLVLNSNFTH